MSRAKKLPSGNWRVNQYIGRDKDGKRRYKSFTAATKKAAEFMAAEYVAAHRDDFNEDITVGEAIDRYIASKDAVLSPTTLWAYKKIRRNHFQTLMPVRLSAITRELVQKAVNEMAKTRSAKTVLNAHGLLAAALRMHKPDLVLHTTLPRKVRKLRNDLPTADEVIAAVRGSDIEIPVLLALCLCLRMSEVRGVRKASIQRGLLFIDRVVVSAEGKQIEKELAKTDASRRVEKIPPFLATMILERDEEYVTKMTGNAIYKVFKKLMVKAGYPTVRFHDLRHIAASDMHRAGIIDRVAAERGGWSGTQTMQRVYQHTFSEDRQQADETMIEYYEKLYKELDIGSIGHEADAKENC